MFSCSNATKGRCVVFDDFIEAPFINCKNESRKCSSSYHFLTRRINTGWPRSMNRLHEARKQFYTPGGQKTFRNNLVTNHLTCINAESPSQLCNSGFALCPTKHPAFSCSFTNAMFSFRQENGGFKNAMFSCSNATKGRMISNPFTCFI